MLSLNSPEWANLEHAYGPASDIPELLRQLQDLPDAVGNSEPWFSIWSALAHQGDVYSASFAAVPHVVQVLASAPGRVSQVYFQFPAWVEICRRKHSLELPKSLSSSYLDALSQLPALVAAASSRSWDSDFMRSALAAIAVAKGSHQVAEACMELAPQVATDFLAWFEDR
jgi:hypothetical protein